MKVLFYYTSNNKLVVLEEDFAIILGLEACVEKISMVGTHICYAIQRHFAFEVSDLFAFIAAD